MKLAIHLSEANAKQLRSFIQCCSRIGSTLLIEATPSQLLLRVINSAKSACFVVTLPSTFFSSFELYQVESLNASLLVKHVLSAFRTHRMKHMDIEIVQDDKMTITVESESGLYKTYRIACVNEEHLSATVDRSIFPTSMTADAHSLAAVLSSFQTTLDEVTLVARPQQAGRHDAHCIQLVSYVDAAKEQVLTRKGTSLRTNVQVATHGHDLFKAYTHASDAPADVTFNLKDFRVIMTLCDLVHADVLIRIGTAGTPLLAEPVWDTRGAEGSDVQAELLLATMAESILESLQDPFLGEVPANALNVTPAGQHTGTVETPGATVFRTPGTRATAAAAPATAPRAHAAPNFDLPDGLETLPPARAHPGHSPAPALDPQLHTSAFMDADPPSAHAAVAAQPPAPSQAAVPRSLFSQHVASLAEDLAAQQGGRSPSQQHDAYNSADEFELPVESEPAGLASLHNAAAARSPPTPAALPKDLRTVQRVGMRHEAEAEMEDDQEGADEFAMDDEEECGATPPDHRPDIPGPELFANF